MEEEKVNIQAARDESQKEANTLRDSLQKKEKAFCTLREKYDELNKISKDAETKLKELEDKLEEKRAQVKTITSQLNADRVGFKTASSESKKACDDIVKEKEVLLEKIQSHESETQQKKMEELSMELVRLKEEVQEKENICAPVRTTDQETQTIDTPLLPTANTLTQETAKPPMPQLSKRRK